MYWLVALALGPASYAQAQALLGSIFGRLLLFLWTFAFFFHLSNGIRHLFWDAGVGLDLETAYATGKIVVGAAGALTLVSWIIAYAI